MIGSRDLLYLCILIAIGLHLLVGKYAGDLFREDQKQAQKQEEKPIEIAPFKDDRQIVHTDRVEDNEKLKDKTARFGGLYKNRTEKETQSPIRDRFRSGGPTAPKLPDFGNEKKIGGMTMHDLMPFGSSPDQLPDDIAPGNETVLNTDPVLYASFMERVADMIYDSWRRNLDTAAEAMALRGKKITPHTFVTRLIVTMNREGDVTAIEVIQSCGSPEIDDAPKQAFFRNSPFRNPPSQLVQKDGYIHLPYQFTFDVRSSNLFVAPWGI
jgi:hypothetical protein